MLDLQLRGLIRGARRSIVFLPFRSLAFPAISARPIKLLKKCGEVLKRGEFVKAEEFLFLDLFVAERVLADGSFEERKRIEEVDLGSCVIDAELEVLL